MTAGPSPIDEYLFELRTKLRHSPSAAKRVARETKDHLLELVEKLTTDGLSPREAEERAVELFGSVDNLVGHLPVEEQRGLERSRWGIPLGLVSGALVGAAFSNFGRIDSQGPHLVGGNEWTGLVTFAGLILGAAVGSLLGYRRYLGVLFGAVGGLWVGLVLRDWILLHPSLFGTYEVIEITGLPEGIRRYDQPGLPVILVIVFGSALLGALLGAIPSFVRRRRSV